MSIRSASGLRPLLAKRRHRASAEGGCAGKLGRKGGAPAVLVAPDDISRTILRVLHGLVNTEHRRYAHVALGEPTLHSARVPILKTAWISPLMALHSSPSAPRRSARWGRPISQTNSSQNLCSRFATARPSVFRLIEPECVVSGRAICRLRCPIRRRYPDHRHIEQVERQRYVRHGYVIDGLVRLSGRSAPRRRW